MLMRSLGFWFVYFTLDAIYKVKTGFIMAILRKVKTWQLTLISYHKENEGFFLGTLGLIYGNLIFRELKFYKT